MIVKIHWKRTSNNADYVNEKSLQTSEGTFQGFGILWFYVSKKCFHVQKIHF